jgi:hypothetical protein
MLKPLRAPHPVAVWLFLASLGLAARPVAAAKFAGAFMESGGGARALSLGGAFTAVADDASATFWNPAGLSTITARQLLLMHEERFGGLVDRDFAAYVQPVSWALLGGEEAGVGVSVIRLGVDDIPFTEHLRSQLDDNGDGIVDDEELLGLFELQDQIRFKSDSELALLISYGERRGAWRFGGSLKFIRQSVGEYSSTGIGFDAAALRPGVWRRLDFGVKLQDATSTYLSWSTGKNEVIVPAVVPGLAWRQPLPRWNASLLLASALETRFEDRGQADQFAWGDVGANLHLGLEIGFRERVFLRGGFDSGFGSQDLTAGAGFRLDRLTIDYAYAGDTLDIDEVTHRISLGVRF